MEKDKIYQIKDERMIHVIKDLAAQYVARHTNRQSLLTVTRIMLSNDQKQVNIMLSVMPRTAEKGALDFLNRGREDFRTFMKERAKLHTIPYVRFLIDEGEYNRQRVSELLDEEEMSPNEK
jgi:ribosome-binding factor A